MAHGVVHHLFQQKSGVGSPIASDVENHIQGGMVHGTSHSFAFGGDTTKLTGTVEVDETFVGGKGEAKSNFSRHIPVVALIERGGKMHTRVVSKRIAKESWLVPC